MSNHMYVSYLVRFWQEETGGEPQTPWRGEVESVQTGQKWQLNSLSDLSQFIQSQVEVQPPSISEKAGNH
ncbi:MAG: hypothetical protein KC445_02380 [Anaerolineales bacterium]|nr:hypothetical protein [Anaerolineales bacterium]